MVNLNRFLILLFSASGCPIANRNKMRVLESGGTLDQHKASVVSATSLKFDPGNCPTPGKSSARCLDDERFPHEFLCYSGCTTTGATPLKKAKYPDDVTMVYPKGYSGKCNNFSFSIDHPFRSSACCLIDFRYLLTSIAVLIFIAFVSQ